MCLLINTPCRMLNALLHNNDNRVLSKKKQQQQQNKIKQKQKTTTTTLETVVHLHQLKLKISVNYLYYEDSLFAEKTIFTLPNLLSAFKLVQTCIIWK